MNKLLTRKIDFILEHNTQTEFAQELNINQWSLLTKIKDNSFSKSELMKISKIYRNLYTQTIKI